MYMVLYFFFPFKTFLFLLVWLLLLLSGDVEMNPGPCRSPDVRVMHSNIRGLYVNLAELELTAAGFDVLCLSETLVTSRSQLSDIRMYGFVLPLQRLAGGDGSRGLALYIRNGCLSFRQSKFECVCHEVMIFRICGPLQNFYVFSVYRSPNTNDSIFDCLLLTIAKIQEVDHRAAFVFVGDVNAHHAEWLLSRSPTNSSGRAALDFCSLSGCRQLVAAPTHESGNCLDLVMTDVADVVDVSVGTPIGTSDHCFLHLAIKVSQVVPFHNVRRTIFVKGRVDWDIVRSDVVNLPWGDIYRSLDPISLLNDSIAAVVARRVPTTVMNFRSSDKPWFTPDCRLAFDRKQTAYRAWTRGRSRELWLDYLRTRAESQQVYSDAKESHCNRARDELNSSASAHKWWETLKGTLFGSVPSLPALVSPGGRLVYTPVEKADLLSSHFDSKQSRASIVVPTSCFPKARCCSLAFRSSLVEKYLRELDDYGGVDPVGVFPLFYKRVADILAPRLSRIFRRLLRSGSFPKCWRVANITAIPKDGLSADVSDYRPISITPILSKIYEKLLSRKLSRYCESEGLFPASQFSYRKGYGCVDALLSVSHVIQQALDCGSECKVVQLDFSAAFDRVNHAGLVYRLQCLGVGGSFLGTCREFLAERSQFVVVDGSACAQVDVVSGVPQGSVQRPLLLILYTSELFDIVENHPIGYADDSTLVRRPCDRPVVEASIMRDLVSISKWCSDSEMKLNPGKTKSLIVSRSRTSTPQHGFYILDGIRIDNRASLKILGVEFDSKLTFESHLRSIASASSRNIGLLRMARRVFGDVDLLRRCFLAFILPSLEYCSSVWSSSAACHLSLLDRVVRNASELCGVDVLVSLSHRRDVAGLCMFYKIYDNALHPLNSSVQIAPRRLRATRAGVNAHCFEVDLCRFRTVQFGRSFVPAISRAWNCLPEFVFDGGCIDKFKRAVNLWLSDV